MPLPPPLGESRPVHVDRRGNDERAIDWQTQPYIAVNIPQKSYLHSSDCCQNIFIINIHKIIISI